MVGPEAYNLEETVTGERFHEKNESLLGGLHLLARHRPAAIHDEDVEQLLRGLFAFVLRRKLIIHDLQAIRLLLFKAICCNGNQECDLISILLGNYNRLHHLLCPIIDGHV
jgi:hypothetical protein